MKESTRKVFDYVKSMEGKNITANDVAEAIGIDSRSVNGSVTAFQKKGYMKRIPAVIETEDGGSQPVKFIQMTPEGMEFDPDAEEAAATAKADE